MASSFQIARLDTAGSGRDPDESYRAMFAAAPRGILLLDSETHEVLDANPMARALLNAPAGLRGRVLFDIPFFRGLPDLDRTLQQLAGNRYVSYDAVPIHAGSRAGVVVEVTFHAYRAGARHVIECNLNPATDRLRKQARERRANTISALARMAEQVAAELNRLLPVISASSELAVGPEALVPSCHSLEAVQKARVRLVTLARGLVAFSGKQALRLQRVDLNELLLGMDVPMREALGDRVELVRELSPEPRAVRADPAGLRQVILALAEFAGRRMPGGGRFRIATSISDEQNGVLRDLRAAPGRYVRIACSDEGGGMDDHVWSHLFEPFGCSAGDEPGLAMAAAYGCLKQCGGYITVSSGHGGVTFQIYLPAVADVAAVEAAGTRPDPGRTIVLFEREEGLRKLVHNLLARKGYEVLEAAGEGEVRRCFQDRGDAIHLLPASARAASLAANLAAAHRGLKVIYILEFAEDAEPVDGPPPAAVILQKRFRPDTLLAKIHEVLDNSQSEMNEVKGICFRCRAF